ncbi:MAG: hypothetical protein KKC14_18025 [Alphaproteobacteria bacterium]|nr:hypothetical protein [Alphaproteobacteria bacterium]
MRHRPLWSLLGLGLALTGLPAAAQPPLDIAALRLATAGRWEGKLEYLDYGANRWFGLPMKLLIEDGGDGVTLIRKADFDDGPKVGAVRITTVDLLDTATRKETSASFRKGRETSLETSALRLAAPPVDATHWTIVAETDSRDDDRPARLRVTTVRDGDRMTTLKEVDFLDDAAETWIQRNRSTLTRVGG